jgi:spore coat polysaccharide biosynthesis protein SpsF (cytidylyltransferase family)
MKIGALVPIRLSSERLPRKALLPIGNRPAVAHLLDRLFASRYLEPERVVVCTTEDPTDDALVPVVEATGAKVFRGSRDDIIGRFNSAAHLHGFDAIIQADGDDPFTDTGYMDRCMQRLLEDEDLDIVISRGLPLGLNSKAVRTSAIARVHEHCLTEKNDHGFILLFTETGLCRKAVVTPVAREHEHPTARITLDYPEDLDFFNALHSAIGSGPGPFGVAEIVAALNAQPGLLEMNVHLNEAYSERTRARMDLKYLRDGKVMDVEVEE